MSSEECVRDRDATPEDLGAVAPWIGSRRECELWAGPGIPFPLEPCALAAQIEIAGAINVVLEDDHGLAAFGQALTKPSGCAHLARVIVRPDRRGRGVGRVLVTALLARARDSGFASATLNVCRDNAPALALYHALGFHCAERPEDEPSSSATWFMRRDTEPNATATSSVAAPRSTRP